MVFLGCQTPGLFENTYEKQCPTSCGENTFRIETGTLVLSVNWNGRVQHVTPTRV